MTPSTGVVAPDLGRLQSSRFARSVIDALSPPPPPLSLNFTLASALPTAGVHNKWLV